MTNVQDQKESGHNNLEKLKQKVWKQKLHRNIINIYAYRGLICEKKDQRKVIRDNRKSRKSFVNIFSGVLNIQ